MNPRLPFWAAMATHTCRAACAHAQTLYYQLGALLLSTVLLAAGVPERAVMPDSVGVWLLLLLSGVALFA